MKKTGKNFLTAETIDSILEAARHTTGLPMSSQELALMQSLAKNAREATQRVAAARATLEELAADIDSVRRTGEVVGVPTAAVFVAMLGDFNRYPSPKALLKAAGLNLKVRSSGKRKGQLAITKRGSSVVRQWLYMATLRWIKNDPIARAWYQSKLARNGKIALKAITALMRKLLAGIYHVARGQELTLGKLFDLSRLDISQ
jgi:transposase